MDKELCTTMCPRPGAQVRTGKTGSQFEFEPGDPGGSYDLAPAQPTSEIFVFTEIGSTELGTFRGQLTGDSLKSDQFQDFLTFFVDFGPR